MKKALTAAALAASLLVSGCETKVPGKPGSEILEDDPRWDCRVQGNQDCGPPERKA